MDNSRKEIRITVVIPAYNVEKYISRCIESALGQSFKPYEILVVDDGSTDNTAKLIKNYDKVVRYVFQENSGSSSARNFGIRQAKGDWIAFLDSDDEWLEDHLLNFVNTVNDFSDIQWYGAPFKMLDENTRKVLFKVNKHHFKKNNIHTVFEDYMNVFPPKAYLSSPTMIIHKAVFNKVGSFDTSKKTAVDLDMWFRIGLEFPKIGYSYAEAAIVYRRDFSLSTSKKWDPDKAIKRFKECQSRAEKRGMKKRADIRVSYWVKSLSKDALKKKDNKTLKKIYANFSDTLVLKEKIVFKIVFAVISLIGVFKKER